MAVFLTRASGSRVLCGNSSNLNDWTQGTYLAWVFCSGSPSTDGHFIQKGWNTVYKYMAFDATRYYGTIKRTSDLTANANYGSFSAWAANTWLFCAFRWDTTSGVAADQKLLMGNLTRLAAEPTSYVAQAAGSGTVVSDASIEMSLGDRPTGGLGIQGAMAWAGAWNRPMSVAEIQEQQFSPHVTSGCHLFMWLHGTGAQTDLSGYQNNSTAVYSLSYNAHVPLRPPWGYDRHTALAMGVRLSAAQQGSGIHLSWAE